MPGATDELTNLLRTLCPSSVFELKSAHFVFHADASITHHTMPAQHILLDLRPIPINPTTLEKQGALPSFIDLTHLLLQVVHADQ